VFYNFHIWRFSSIVQEIGVTRTQTCLRWNENQGLAPWARTRAEPAPGASRALTVHRGSRPGVCARRQRRQPVPLRPLPRSALIPFGFYADTRWHAVRRHRRLVSLRHAPPVTVLPLLLKPRS
jgi:hypothetical protein